MESRGQKRSEVGELPVEKRACTSFTSDLQDSENLSNSQTAVNSVSSIVSEDRNVEMDTEAVGTTNLVDEDDANVHDGFTDSEGSDDEEESEHERSILAVYQQSRSSDQSVNLSKVISDFNKQDIDESEQLVALTNLCEQLSFLNEHSLTSGMVTLLSPILVRLAKHESNPNIMLLAIRAITYTCDIFPRAAGIFVRFEAVPALCQRLIAIEYLDVAEQCLQALDKIAHDQPMACLQSGVIMASLTFIDFFSASIQRVALSIVVNICRKLPSQFPSSLMEALPILCGILQYEDQQVVESAATCLIKLTTQFSQSLELLDELCKQGVIIHIIRIIDINNRSTRPALSQSIYTGLIGMLSKLACGSLLAYKALFEHNISTIVRDILYATFHSSRLHCVIANSGHYNQMQEIMKLVNSLLPNLDEEQNDATGSDNKSYLVEHPDILHQLGADIIPPLIQVVNMGSDTHISYGCLSFINKLVYFSEPEGLLELLQDLNISSFLAGVFTRKDHHLLLLALHISDVILRKQSDYFINSFVKDGVLYAVEAMLKIELSSQFLSPVIDGTSISNERSQLTPRQDVGRCLCYALCPGQSFGSSPCKLKHDSIISLAKQIKLNFFPEESSNSNKLSEIHQELKVSAARIMELQTGIRLRDSSHFELEKELHDVLSIILKKLNGSEPVSTFEFIDSGVVQALLTFLSHGTHTRKDSVNVTSINHSKVDKRFQTFAKLSTSLIYNHSGDLHILTLVRKLQNALSTVENFPVILCQPYKRRSSLASVPDARVTMHPTFKVLFLKGEEDQSLGDYKGSYVNVDSFASLKSIEEHLWSRVSKKNKEGVETSRQADVERVYTPDGMKVVETYQMETDFSKIVAIPSEQDMDADAHLGNKELKVAESHLPVIMQEQCYRLSSNNVTSPNLSLYFGDQHLDLGLTLYQAVLQQQMKPGYDPANSTQFWTRVYTITYNRALSCEGSSLNQCSQSESRQNAQNLEPSWLCQSNIFKLFDSKTVSGLDQIGPTRDFVYLIKCLELMNKNISRLLYLEQIYTFANKNVEELNLLAHGSTVPQTEFVNSKLTEKLEQQMKDPAATTVQGLPSWWNQLVESCPFLFAFDARCKYFLLSVIGLQKDVPHSTSQTSVNDSVERRTSSNGLPRKKFIAIRDQILESASKMVKQHANRKAIVEIEFANEVGTGLGPTLEFYTTVSHEFQRRGMGMWREDSLTHHADEAGGFLLSTSGLFPRPWNCLENGSDVRMFSEVIKNFTLLGQIVAKALHDGRVLDLPLSKAFYKIILGQKLELYDITLFDPELGRSLLKFKAISRKNRAGTMVFGECSTSEMPTGFHHTEIDDLSLDFTLPGYPDYVLPSENYYEMVTMDNLEEYVSFVEDATLESGIVRQVEAFKAGFNQVFPIEHTHIFNEEELERLLCGEQSFLTHPDELIDHVKFDHGYTASSPTIINLLELLQEFDHDQRRAFVQFVTGTPRLPPGGLASLSPRLTVVRKHSDNFVDAELPSAMTCANYLKLPPYSTKEIMKQKLLYAISEGQGAFHLS